MHYRGIYMTYRISQRSIGLAAMALFALGATASVRAQQAFKNTVVPTAVTQQTIWKYTTVDPGLDWQTSDFLDGDWESGPGGFGSRITPSAVVGTEWTTSDIWIRKVVTLPDIATLDGLGLIVHHDEAVEIYVNGTLVLQDTGYSRDYYSSVLDLEARNAFVTGDNLIAVHCHQTEGGQFIDVGVESVISGSATVLVADARDKSEEWKFTTEEPGTSNWVTAGFNDDSWPSGTAGFGALETPGGVVGTMWSTGDIWLRKTFNVDALPYQHYYLSIHHDENAVVAINGVTVLQVVGYTTDYTDVDISAVAKDAIHPGENVIAVYCHQTDGGQYIDVGLKAVLSEPPVALRPRSRAQASARKAFTWSPAYGLLFPGQAAGSPFRFDALGKSRSLPRSGR
ncbi:MAG: hypothetical protein JWP91_874 [Fibrobacteres bacterium]|nr:hypothetical protein [Fibrobacterota bacterium]